MSRRHVVAYALLAPAFLPVFGVLAYPLGYDLWLSLSEGGAGPGAGRFVGLRHYRSLGGDAVFWQAVWNTTGLVIVTALVEVVIGLLTALLLWWRFWGRTLVLFSVFVPWAFPATFSAFAWYWLLLPPFPTFYTLELQTVRWWVDDLAGLGAWQVVSMAIMTVWRGSSIIAVFLLAGLNAIPDELLDVGRLEAPSAWRYFWHVVAPLSRRFLVLAALLAVVITYAEYAAMYVETGGRITVPVLGTLAFREAIHNGDLNRGAALALVPIPFGVGLVLLGLRLVEERGAVPVVAEPTGGAPSARRPPDRERRGPGRATAATPRWRRRLRLGLIRASGLAAAVVVTVFHIFPVYYTAVQAFRSVPEYARGNPFWVYDPTLEDVREVLQNPVIWRWAGNTVVVFGAVLVVSLAAAVLGGYALARFRLPGGRWLARLAFASYFISPTAVVVPAYQLFLRWDLDDTILALVLLYLTLAIPFATWLFYMYFQGVPADVEEVALLDGSRTAVFLRVVLPMTGPIMIAAGLFSVGMMASDVLYGSTFSLSDATKTLPAGLGLTAVQLDEWAFANAAILLASLPIILVCAALSPYYVRGLRAALIEGA